MAEPQPATETDARNAPKTNGKPAKLNRLNVNLRIEYPARRMLDVNDYVVAITQNFDVLAATWNTRHLDGVVLWIYWRSQPDFDGF
ncbi:hypothetical protein [Candidatus Binatus sp.]|uniref:hypothetical protein n=1 Tax=Candidatus Binatus sp. TaxID=2811406 RepID=UPI003C719DE4